MKPAVTVDVGTTRVKLCLFDAAGDLRAARKEDTPVTQDAWGQIYDVDRLMGLVERFLAGLDDADRASVERIALAGVGESGGLVGPDLRLRSPMILWHDHRGAAVLERLGPGQRALVQQVTGLPVNANYALSKVAWAVDHAGDDAADATWLNVSEFLAARMTGHRWAEPSLASRTMALDLRTGTWSPEVCALVGLDVSVFPELRSASSGVPVSGAFASRMGLDRSVEVHVVGHDHMVGAVAAGLRTGEVLNSTGTTEGLLLLRDEPDVGAAADGSRLANGLACDGSGYTLFASIPTGGSAFATLQRMLGMSAGTLSACVAGLDERYVQGAVDLRAIPVVVPHFRGSPPPAKDASARGVIANLGSDVTAEDLVLGCFLGMVVELRRVLDLFPAPPTTLKVIGPASENPLWLHLKADLLGCDLTVSNVDEVVSRGAQALSSRERRDWSACRPRDVRADAVRHQRLLDWYEGARPTMARLGDLAW